MNRDFALEDKPSFPDNRNQTDVGETRRNDRGRVSLVGHVNYWVSFGFLGTVVRTFRANSYVNVSPDVRAVWRLGSLRLQGVVVLLG